MHAPRSSPAPEMPTCRVGVDLAAVADVQRSLERQGDSYLSRLFTEHEVASSQGATGPAADSLAARFAAKEAVLKVLRPADGQPEWRDIEVHRHSSGACDIVLHRGAADLAEAQGIDGMSLSMSHEAGMAVAVVVAWCRPRPTDPAKPG
jgi:holo-[acyl-carrier protein] synthase